MDELEKIIADQCRNPEFKAGFLQCQQKLEFTNFVSTLLEENHLSERELARLSGVELSTIKQIESIEIAPDLELMNQLAHAVGGIVSFSVSYDDLTSLSQ